MSTILNYLISVNQKLVQIRRYVLSQSVCSRIENFSLLDCQ